MNKEFGYLLAFFALALVVSFVCSLLEAVLLTVTPAYIETLTNKKRRSGYVLRKFKKNIDRPLAAILTLNTVANTVGAAGVGAQAGKIYGRTWVMLVSGILTLAILIFSEIIPKTLGAVFWKKLATPAAYVIKLLIWILNPVVTALEWISRLITPAGYRSVMSREEMMATAEMGRAEGTLQTRETRIITNLLCMDKIKAKDVLTPRNVVFAMNRNKTVGQAVRKHSPIRFSRIPVYGKNLDDITGFVHRYQILQGYAKGKLNTALSSIARPLHAVPEMKTMASILDEFIQRREHIFLVVDEYGGTAGIVTLEDAVETLLGVEIVDELDTVEDMRKLAKQIWQRRKKDQKTFSDTNGIDKATDEKSGEING